MDKPNQTILHSTYDLPLSRFTPNDIANKITSWVEQDINYQKYSKQTKQICTHFGLSGNLMCVLKPEQVKLIIKDEMLKFMTPETLDVIFDRCSEWKDLNSEEDIKSKSTDEIADILYNFPLNNLINRIYDENIDGKYFMTKQCIITEATGWDLDDSYQIENIILKHHTFIRKKFIQHMNNIFKKPNYSTILPETVVNRIKKK
eukprot:532769_1